MARAKATVWRPDEIKMSGQGGLKLSPPGPAAKNGFTQSCGGKNDHGQRGEILLICGSRPSFSARPTHWLSIPALPSVTTQHLRFSFSKVITDIFTAIDDCGPLKDNVSYL